MQFRNDRPIYVQIMETIHEQVLSGALPPEERVPAVRELAVQLQVNPNTVVKSFTELEETGVIYKKRGLGYYVAAEARERVLERRRKEFLENTLPDVVRTMKILGLTLDDVESEFEKTTIGGEKKQ